MAENAKPGWSSLTQREMLESAWIPEARNRRVWNSLMNRSTWRQRKWNKYSIRETNVETKEYEVKCGA